MFICIFLRPWIKWNQKRNRKVYYYEVRIFEVLTLLFNLSVEYVYTCVRGQAGFHRELFEQFVLDTAQVSSWSSEQRLFAPKFSLLYVV